MENTSSPLKKYQRQPKLYISLPSGGRFYDSVVLHNNTYTDLPVFSMTASDEILFKTPDAMITGNATTANIKNCCPSILDPWKVVTLDVDYLLMAIRVATYGNSMTVQHRCSKCNTENAYQVDLTKYMEHFGRQEFKDTVMIEDFTVKLRPLTYTKWTEVQKKTIGLQRALYQQSNSIEDEEQKAQFIDQIVLQINELALSTVFDFVEYIEVGGEKETDKNEIIEFLKTQDVAHFHAIKKVIDDNVDRWQIPSEQVECENCKAQNTLKVSLDASDFFVTG